MTNIEWVYIAGGVLMVLLLAAFWRRIVRAIVLLAGMGLIGMLVWALAQQAGATRQASTAATVAATGSAAGNVAAGLLAVLLVLTVSVGGVYVWRLRRRITAGEGEGASQVMGDPMQMIQALVSLEALRMIREMRGGQRQQPQWALSVDDVDDVGNADGVMPAWW